MTPIEIRGVPQGLAMDAWWLDTGGRPDSAPPDPTTNGPVVTPPLAAALVAVVLLADLLFWGAALGLSVAVFALCLTLLVQFGHPRVPVRTAPYLVLALGVAPVVIHVQALSLGFALLGTLAAVALLQRGTTGAPVWRWGLGAVTHAPHQVCSLMRAAWMSRGVGGPVTLRQILQGWSLPLGGALIFGSLLIQANPLIEQTLTTGPDPFVLAQRAMFWTGAALACWPLILPIRPVTAPGPGAPRLPVNAAAVSRALWTFNLLIAVQTGLDASILLGGARLPEGMSYATYAHRGAYPLMATALLAGGFAALVQPFLAENPGFRPLLILWIVQNLALTAAAFLRLDLYVEAYGLTYLRLHAQVWIVVVALGLGLCLWQALARHDTGWLARRVVLLAGLTLYGACFVNFAHVITQTNLARPKPDYAYLCPLGPMPVTLPPEAGCARDVPETSDWREWGFRNWRAARYHAAMSTPVGSPPE